jgi:hypothetical protein
MECEVLGLWPSCDAGVKFWAIGASPTRKMKSNQPIRSNRVFVVSRLEAQYEPADEGSAAPGPRIGSALVCKGLIFNMKRTALLLACRLRVRP